MNYYVIILVLVTLAGIAVTLWGLKMQQQAKTRRAWPCVEGSIIESLISSKENDLLPGIRFEYQVDERNLQAAIRFPPGTQPMPEFSRSYIEKYPLGHKVTVYYNPDAPEDATLEPEGGKDNWMILGLGIGATLFGLYALIF